MAKLQVYSVYDNAVKTFMRPFQTVTNAAAIRDFEEACSQADSPFGKHPGDFTLFALGTFDDQSGEYVSVVPQRIIGALECIATRDAKNYIAPNGRTPAVAS